MFSNLKRRLTTAGIISEYNFLVRCLGYGAAALVLLMIFTGALFKSAPTTQLAQVPSAAVTPGSRYLSGWAINDHYTLRTDAQGWSIVEPGRNHRKLHVSPNGSPTADGLTPETAVTPAAAEKIWPQIISEHKKTGAPGPSHWLLFERGHTYAFKNMVPRNTRGESPLHPLLIGAYGTGARPIMTERQSLSGTNASNIVIRDLHFKRSFRIVGPVQHFLFEGNEFSRDQTGADGLQSSGNGLGIQGNIDYVTVYRNIFKDMYKAVPKSPSGFGGLGDHTAGVYATGIRGFLLEENISDHNGWHRDYRTDPTKHPPTRYSHNYYLSWGNRNLTFRNNIVARGASFGTQVRSSGFVVDNIFVDNNAALNMLGGGFVDEAPVDDEESQVVADDDETNADIKSYKKLAGNHPWIQNIVVTSAGYKPHPVGGGGAINWGFGGGYGQGVIKNAIVMHASNPNDPVEIAAKPKIDDAGGFRNPLPPGSSPLANYVEEVYVHRWGKNGVPPIDPTKYSVDLNQITIQNYARDLLGPNRNTIKDLMEYLRVRDRNDWNTKPDARAINKYFQQALNLYTPPRTTPSQFTFSPFQYGDQVRWDNSLNWSIEDIPGEVDGDTVNLAGRSVNYSGSYVLDSITFGSGGSLAVHHGALTLRNGFVSTGGSGKLSVGRVGQVFVQSYTSSQPLSVEQTGGRYMNTGIHTGGIKVTSSNGELIFGIPGSEFRVGSGSFVSIASPTVLAGFDGPAGTATLRLQSGGRLAYVATTAGLGTIGEFRSGYFGTTPPDLMSVMTIEPGATLTLDLRALPATTTTRIFTLANVDELSGTFTTHDVQGIGQNGITGARLVYNYDTDDLVLQVFSSPAAGTGFTFVTQTNNVVSDGGAIVTTPTSTTPVIPTPPTTPPKPTNPLTQPQIKALLPRGTASTTLRYRGVTGADLPDGTRCNTAALIDKLNTDRERFHALAVKRQAACLRELRQRAVSEVQADPTHTYPVGLFDFTIDTTPGGTEEVTLTLDQRYDTDDWVYRKYKDGTYTTIPNVTYGTRRIDGTTVTTVTYSVTDNGPLDLDQTLGIIRDPAGPAIPSTPPTTPDPVIPPVSEPPVTEPSRSSGGGGGTATRTNRSASLTRLTKNLSYVQPQFNDRTEVEALQRALNHFENANLTVTGTFDAPTFTAVKAFQTKYRRQILDIWNLTEATGYVGITTRLKLNSLIGGQTTTCPAFTEYNGGLSGIRQSPEIGRTQQILQELGMYQGPINNTWDTATNQALITFQETFREVMLDPWNITAGTGYKYKTTNLFLNYFVGCETGTVELEGVGRWGM